MEPADRIGRPRATSDTAGSPLGAVFEILGRLVSIFVLGWMIFAGHSSPLLFLWGLWIEEVFSLVGLSVRKAVVRWAGADSAPTGLYFVFPAAHLVFVLFFTMIGTTGMFSRAGAELQEAPSVAVLAKVAAAFLFWTVLDVIRAAVRLRRGGSREEEFAAIDKGARLALFLPHITIIAGGFCLIMFRLGNWLAWGILAGKVLFEALSFFAGRGRSHAAHGR